MKTRVPATFLSVICGLFLLLAGCQENPDEPAGALSESPIPGGTAVVALPAEPSSLNPVMRSSAYTGQTLAVMMRSLSELDDDLNVIPSVASGWDIAEDGRSLTCYLRPWKWADGAPLQARDIVISSELLRNPVVASPRSGEQAYVVGVTEIDSATVRFDFDRSVAEPLRPTLSPIMPWHIVKDLDPAEIGRWPINEQPVCNGSFKLEEWDRNEQLVLRRNELCGSRVPLLERLVLRIIPDETARVVALETGHVDMMEEVPISAAKRMAQGDEVVIHRVGGRLVGYISLNFRRPLFNDRRVRRAISVGIDRSRFVDGLLGGFGRPAGSPIPPGLWAHSADVAPHPFDPAEAKRLLTEAGWLDADGDGILEKNGQALTFELLTRTGDVIREEGAVVIRDNLRAIGVDLQLRIMEHGASLARVRDGNYDAYLGLVAAGLLVDPSAQLHSNAVDRFNYGAYADATTDSLLELGLATRDRAAAMPVWEALQRRVAEELPLVPIYYPDTLIGVSRRLHDVRPHMLSPLNNVSQWWIAEADRKYHSAEQ